VSLYPPINLRPVLVAVEPSHTHGVFQESAAWFGACCLHPESNVPVDARNL